MQSDTVFHSTKVLKFLRKPVFALILIVSAFRLAFHFFLFPEPVIAVDSVSYIAASQTVFDRLFQGIPDRDRTPFYPMVLALARFLFGAERQFAAVVLFQRAISLLSVYFFYRTARLLLKSLRLAFLASLYYACFPAVLSYNAAVLTESLAVSGTVLLLYCLISPLDSPGGYGRTSVAGLSVFFLIMLRPAFFYLLPILLLFFGLRLVLKRKTRLRDALGLTATCLSMLLVLGYCQIFKRHYDIFHVSVIPYLNQFHIVIQSGLYRHADDGDMDERIRRNVAEASERFPDEPPGPAWLYPTGLSEKAFDFVAWTRSGDYLEHPAEMSKYAMRTIRTNGWEYLRYSALKCLGLSPARASHIVTPKDAPENGDRVRRRVAAALNVLFAGFWRFGLVFAILLLESVALLRSAILFRHATDAPTVWSRGLLWLWLTGAYATALIGAQCDWGRLVVPAVPPVILLLAWEVDRLLRLREKP